MTSGFTWDDETIKFRQLGMFGSLDAPELRTQLAKSGLTVVPRAFWLGHLAKLAEDVNVSPYDVRARTVAGILLEIVLLPSVGREELLGAPPVLPFLPSPSEFPKFFWEYRRDALIHVVSTIADPRIQEVIAMLATHCGDYLNYQRALQTARAY